MVRSVMAARDEFSSVAASFLGLPGCNDKEGRACHLSVHHDQDDEDGDGLITIELNWRDESKDLLTGIGVDGVDLTISQARALARFLLFVTEDGDR